MCVCEGQDGRTQGKTGDGKRRYRREEVTKGGGGAGPGKVGMEKERVLKVRRDAGLLPGPG